MTIKTDMDVAAILDRIIRMETRLCTLMKSLGVNPMVNPQQKQHSPHTLIHNSKLERVESVLVDIATETANGNSDPDDMAEALDRIVVLAQGALKDLYGK